MDRMNRRTMIGGAAAMGAVAAAGPAIPAGNVWRTDLNAKFVTLMEAAIGTLKEVGMDVDSGWTMISDHRLPGDAISRRRYVYTLTADGRIDETLLRNLRNGAVEIEGNWWVRCSHPVTEAIGMTFGFMAEESARVEPGPLNTWTT